MSEAWFYHVSSTGKLLRVASVEAALATTKKGGFAWLHYCQPTKEELSDLSEPLGLHALSIEDCFDENQIPKIEDFPRNTFILFNAFGYSDKKLSVDEIDLFIGDNFLVTVSQREAENRQLLSGIERSLATDLESVRHGPAFLMHVILDHVVDQKFLAIEAFEDEPGRRRRSAPGGPFKLQPRRADPLAAGPLKSPQELVPRAGDSRQNLSQRLPLHFGQGHLPLSRHLRPSREILRVDRVLPRYRHQSDGDVPVNAEQPDEQSRQRDQCDRQAADVHHHHFYAAYAPGRHWRNVRVVDDDRT